MATSKREPAESRPMQVLRRFAEKLPATEAGTSCVNRAFRVHGKAFAYLGMKADRYRLMVKLGDSVADAQKLQRQRPDAFAVGKHGWTTVWLPHTEDAAALLQAWIAESYRAFAPAAGTAKARARPAKKKAAARAPGRRR